MSEVNNNNNIEVKEINESVNIKEQEINKSENIKEQECGNEKQNEVKTISSNKSQLIKIRDLNGVFCVNKPIGLSSNDVVSILKNKLSSKLLNLKLIQNSRKRKNLIKIGHGGTLDPLATGCLVIGIFDGTKMLNSLLSGNKVYEAVGRFGSSTTTYDCVGELLEEKPYDHITKEKLEEVLKEFVGEIEQIPPLYSALKIDGKRLYEYARSGEELPKEIKKRKINISKIELLEFNPTPTKSVPIELENNDDYEFTQMDESTENQTTDNAEKEKKSRRERRRERSNRRERNNGGKFTVVNKAKPNEKLPEGPTFKIRVECGGGTYIRSLIYDIGKKIESEAHMIELVRTKQGQFDINDAITLKECDDLKEIAKALKKN